MTETIGLMDAMATTRSIRRFRPDPIADNLLRSLLEAATWAPSGSNMQNWRLLVVRDSEKRRQIGEFYRAAFDEFYPRERLASESDPSSQRMMAGAIYLADHMGTEPPVLVLFCRDTPSTSPFSRDWTRGASIYPAVQNLLLACRAEGLGCVLTTLLCRNEPELRPLLELPEPWCTAAFVPIGYPVGRGHGMLSRRPVEDMVFGDRFGRALWAQK
jgi:nitroreductase